MHTVTVPRHSPARHGFRDIASDRRLVTFFAMANALSEEKKQQVLALDRPGWSLRRIQQATGIRRETAGGDLKVAGIAIRSPPGLGANLGKTGQLRIRCELIVDARSPRHCSSFLFGTVGFCLAYCAKANPRASLPSTPCCRCADRLPAPGRASTSRSPIGSSPSAYRAPCRRRAR